MDVLALDFDGVIFDSSREAFTMAVRTYAALQPRSSMAHHPLATRSHPDAAVYDFENDTAYRNFNEIVPLGNRAEDFGIALDLIEHGRDVPSQEAYDSAYAETDGRWRQLFHERFYQERTRFRRHDLDQWLSLQKPYGHFIRLLQRRWGETALAIATAKDRASVAVLLAAYGLDQLFEAERIYDKETGTDKREHILRLSRDLDADPNTITFVDDKVKHLQSVAPLGVRGVLAGWGHNTPREHSLAGRLGFSVAQPATVEEILFDHGSQRGDPRR